MSVLIWIELNSWCCICLLRLTSFTHWCSSLFWLRAMASDLLLHTWLQSVSLQAEGCWLMKPTEPHHRLKAETKSCDHQMWRPPPLGCIYKFCPEKLQTESLTKSSPGRARHRLDKQFIWKVFTVLHYFNTLLCYSIIPKLIKVY